MKKLVLPMTVVLALMFGLNFNVHAQSNQEEIDLIQGAFGMNKKDMVANFLQLPADNPFWEIYDSYETERKELGKKRIDLLTKYASNYRNLSEEEIDSYMSEMIKLKKSTDKLIDSYYKKVKKASGSKVAAQFYELEYYILTSVRVIIFDNIPFFGELDN